MPQIPFSGLPWTREALLCIHISKWWQGLFLVICWVCSRAVCFKWLFFNWCCSFLYFVWLQLFPNFSNCSCGYWCAIILVSTSLTDLEKWWGDHFITGASVLFLGLKKKNSPPILVLRFIIGPLWGFWWQKAFFFPWKVRVRHCTYIRSFYFVISLVQQRFVTR